MKAKITPGTWKVCEIIPYKGTSYPGVISDNARGVCSCSHGTREETEANAKLIASAPDLLKSLQFAVKFIQNCPKLTEDEKPRGLEKWEEIIKKATE